ncbi:unnamed protein product [Nezara viridula]|uniref:Uncharacterized protein n=1 Tax=Nezara viridula TaxID=85310 RepID=A0A9P0H1R0_NEZVI|nr:unnamed protein product [Nezara viridula]
MISLLSYSSSANGWLNGLISISSHQLLLLNFKQLLSRYPHIIQLANQSEAHLKILNFLLIFKDNIVSASNLYDPHCIL